ncbi:MAG TPA: acyl-CoA reductase [Dongiaceae bacterium]|nr:acyl-CoA reductase [Dongiaceae bacterium]
MSELIQAVDSPAEIAQAAARLREVALKKDLPSRTVMEMFERWSAALQGNGMESLPGAAFLRLWLRQGTLEPILERELGRDALNGGWREDGRARLRAFPLGTVGHWPAGNIEIQPVLSLTCALLGGNSCLVRVPSVLVDVTRRLLERLRAVDSGGILTERIALLSFDHSREDLQTAMAQNVDGAMIWGGAEAVLQVRALPFPHWTRVAVFGPRLSVAAMDAAVWSEPVERSSWCQRIARDVWQFDQQACSSPQVLFLERGKAGDVGQFVEELKRAFQTENRAHPRGEISPALTSSICLARATWLLENVSNKAWFSQSPDWTILLGEGADIPKPTQGRTLSVLVVDDLLLAISKFDGAVQTLGLAIGDAQKEDALAQTAGRRGVDRIVKLGRMHVFGSPWDGVDLIRPMVRVVRHVPSQN